MVLVKKGTDMQKELFLLFEILEKKNFYLLEFHKINMAELRQLTTKGNVDNLENFYYSRELLLNAINKLDSQISTNKLIKNLKINKKEKRRLMDILNLKREMVMSILEQDLTILSLVDQIKNRNIQTIAS